MKSVPICAAAALAAILVSAAAPSAAQPPGAYWNGDLCHQEKAGAAHRGTFLGALFGGIFGSAVAGRNRAAGAVVGGAAGAVIGHAGGANSVQCEPYPPRVEAHGGACQWVSEYYDGGPHDFEACRDPDGVWRPSGRS